MRKKIKLQINENSSTRFAARIIGVCATVYLIINLSKNQEIYLISIFIIAIYLLIIDESWKLKTDGKEIFISYSNILKILAKNETIRFSDIEKIEFIPSKFSGILFILNRIIRSGSRAYKESILTIYKKNGEKVILTNIGTEDEIYALQQWL